MKVAVEKVGYSIAGVTCFHGVTTSAVNRLASSEELSEVE